MSETTPEEWRPVVGFEGLYEVSDLGRVRSVERVITVPDNRWGGFRQLRLRGQTLKPAPNPYGHLHVNLGRDMTRSVAVLVAEAFISPRPDGLDCLHGPGGRTDNRPENLSWGTKSKNHGPDKVRDGTDPNGDRHGMAKLTWDDVDEIRRRAPQPRKGFPTHQQLADEFGVTRETIGDIVARRSWRPEFRRHAS